MHQQRIGEGEHVLFWKDIRRNKLQTSGTILVITLYLHQW